MFSAQVLFVIFLFRPIGECYKLLLACVMVSKCVILQKRLFKSVVFVP